MVQKKSNFKELLYSMSKHAPFWNWIGGIVAAIIAGFIVWWLTGEKSPFKEKPAPEVGISHFTTNGELFVSENARATINVYNRGTAVANKCKVLWYGQGIDKAPAEGEAFKLIPRDENERHVVSYQFSDTGIFKSIMVLTCENCKPDTAEKEIMVKIRRRVTPVTGTILGASTRLTKVIGGPGGNDFADNPPSNARIEKIAIYGGAISTGIQTTWKQKIGIMEHQSSSPIHGRARTETRMLEMRDGEHVTSVSGYYRKFQSTTSPVVTKLKIETNEGRDIEFGIQEEGAVPFEFRIPTDSVLVGFQGRSGTMLNAIGVVVRRK